MVRSCHIRLRIARALVLEVDREGQWECVNVELSQLVFFLVTRGREPLEMETQVPGASAMDAN
jgi:hypothetical protein